MSTYFVVDLNDQRIISREYRHYDSALKAALEIESGRTHQQLTDESQLEQLIIVLNPKGDN